LDGDHIHYLRINEIPESDAVAMAWDQLTEVVAKYRDHGILRGSDWCLPPTDAVALVHDLEALRIVILRCYVWRWREPGRDPLVALPEAAEIINRRLSESDHEWNAYIVRRSLQEDLPVEADMISFGFDRDTESGIIELVKRE
jgi:hypothetical protein